MTTAASLLNQSLRLLGVVASGETSTAAEASDALEALNLMLDSWSTERLAVFATQDQVFTWPAATATRTLGPSGNFIGVRPINLDDSTYFKDPGSLISYNLKIINQQQYNGIALKAATSTYPQYIWVNYDMPNVMMTVYPVPNRDLSFHLVSVTELSQPAGLSTVFALPPGYLRALKYNLACEMAAEFGVEPTPQVQRIAMVSKRNIKSNNSVMDLMGMPYGILGRQQRFNIFSGSV